MQRNFRGFFYHSSRVSMRTLSLIQLFPKSLSSSQKIKVFMPDFGFGSLPYFASFKAAFKFSSAATGVGFTP